MTHCLFISSMALSAFLAGWSFHEWRRRQTLSVVVRRHSRVEPVRY